MARHKYKAFISYAHADIKFAAWLHRRIESFRLPRRMQRRFGKNALKPVCRDRDDLRSGADLGAEIRAALADSAALIVICSEDAAASPWVNQEIRVFRELHGAERIFAIIVRDAPPACFPPALIEGSAEPIAADARAGQDGRGDALLKLIAGLLDVDFDALKRRDLRRRNQRMSWIAAGSFVLSLSMAGLALVALNARQEAEQRRAQADDLIGFMLGDLRTRLEPIGRLDVLDAVGDKAVDYFAGFDDEELDPASRLEHARALRQIGEVRVFQGNLESAREAFDASNARAQQVIAENDSEAALFEFSQSHFWVGYSHFAQNNLDAAALRFSEYLAVAEALAARAPDNVEYEVEVGYARSNLGTVAVERGRFDDAENHFLASAAISRKHLAADPDNLQLKRDLAETLSWLSRTATYTQPPQLVVERYTQEHSLRQAIAAQGDFDDRYALANTGVILSQHMVLAAQLDAAAEVLAAARAIARELVAHDASNADWRKLHATTFTNQSVLDAIAGHEAALANAQAGVQELRTLVQLDARNSRRRLNLIGSLAQLARLARLAGDEVLLRETLTELMALISTYTPGGSEDERAILARCHLLAGDVLNPEHWQQGLALLEDSRRTLNPLVLLTRQQLAQRLSRDALAATASRRLADLKFRDTQNGAIVGTLVTGSFLTE